MSTVYVTTGGNDSTGDGSAGNPYLTLAKALTVAISGDTINMGAGTFATTTAGTPKTIPSGVSIVGQGSGSTTLSLKDSSNGGVPVLLFHSSATGISFTDLTIASAATGTFDLIDLNGASNTTFTRCIMGSTFSVTAQYLFVQEQGSGQVADGITFNNCTFFGLVAGNPIVLYDISNSQTSGTAYNALANVVFDGGSVAHLVIRGTATTADVPSTALTVRNMTVTKASDTALFDGGVYASGWAGVTISNVVAYNWGGNLTPGAFPGACAGINVLASTNVTIQSCTTYHNVYGLLLQNCTTGDVISHVSYDNRDDGIALIGTSSFTVHADCVSHDNDWSGVIMEGFVNAAATNNVVAGGRYFGNGRRPYSTQPNTGVIPQVEIGNPGGGLGADYAANNEVKNCIVYDSRPVGGVWTSGLSCVVGTMYLQTSGFSTWTTGNRWEFGQVVIDGADSNNYWECVSATQYTAGGGGANSTTAPHSDTTYWRKCASATDAGGVWFECITASSGTIVPSKQVASGVITTYLFRCISQINPRRGIASGESNCSGSVIHDNRIYMPTMSAIYIGVGGATGNMGTIIPPTARVANIGGPGVSSLN